MYYYIMFYTNYCVPRTRTRVYTLYVYCEKRENFFSGEIGGSEFGRACCGLGVSPLRRYVEFPANATA